VSSLPYAFIFTHPYMQNKASPFSRFEPETKLVTVELPLSIVQAVNDMSHRMYIYMLNLLAKYNAILVRSYAQRTSVEGMQFAQRTSGSMDYELGRLEKDPDQLVRQHDG
jgi:hypothetical protein